MRGRGNVVVGPNVRLATARAVFTDENARMQAVALSFGGPVNYISAGEGALRDADPGDPARAWDLWKASVMKSLWLSGLASAALVILAGAAPAAEMPEACNSYKPAVTGGPMPPPDSD